MLSDREQDYEMVSQWEDSEASELPLEDEDDEVGELPPDLDDDEVGELPPELDDDEVGELPPEEQAEAMVGALDAWWATWAQGAPETR